MTLQSIHGTTIPGERFPSYLTVKDAFRGSSTKGLWMMLGCGRCRGEALDNCPPASCREGGGVCHGDDAVPLPAASQCRKDGCGSTTASVSDRDPAHISLSTAKASSMIAHRPSTP